MKPNITILLILSFFLSINQADALNFSTSANVKKYCPAPILTSYQPLAGPENTLITIQGSNFDTASSVTFNGTDASFTIISTNEITALVPVGIADSSIISITSSGGCIGNATTSFTLITSECFTGELYISEIFDSETGSYGIIELYNPTNATITLDGIYTVERYGDIGNAAPSISIPLVNTVGPQQTYNIQLGSTGTDCGVATDLTTATGFNENDEFKLLKNSVLIDVVHAPDEKGYTILRNADATAPNNAFNTTDWLIDSFEDCSDLGMHTADPTSSEVPEITHPMSQNMCANDPTIFTVSVDSGTFSYQWKTLNASGNWVNVSNNAIYSGATTNTLNLTNVPITFDGNQYYCEITSVSCELASNTAQLNIFTSEVDDLTDQNVCSEYTLPALTNGNYFPAPGGTGTPLNPGQVITMTQTIYIFNSVGTCTSESDFTVTISGTPDVDIIAHDEVCAGYTLTALTNGNYFTGPDGTGTQLNAGEIILASQTIYIYNESGIAPNLCSDESSFDIIIYPATDFSLTESNVTINEDSISVIMSDSTINYEYDIDNEGFQPSAMFTNLSNGDHTLTVRDSNGCVTKSLVFQILVDSEELVIPNGFSPNNDGKNDWFNIQGLYNNYQNHKLKIYNRYGTLIFEGNNNNKWYGIANKGLVKGNKVLPVGTYFYVLNLNDSNTSENEYIGWVYLNK
ncbi:T9SS type B sorting domain-containing protein [Psychroserpens sp.]